MTAELIIRSVQLGPVELEGNEGRTLHARMLAWDAVSRVEDVGKMPYDEAWKRGVFTQSIRRAQRTNRGWPLLFNHRVQDMPIGMVSAIHERDDGPWLTAKISNTQLGNDVIELVRDGAIPGVSIHGRNIKSRRRPDGVIERMEVALTEISMTPFPALIGSDEMVLRSLVQERRDEEDREEYVKGSADELREFLAQLDDPLSDKVT